MQHHPEWQAEKPNSAQEELAAFIGEWDMVGTHPAFAAAANGHSTFRWLQGEALLVWDFDWEQPGPPSAISVIGHDDAGDSYSVLYADERSVSRVYHITIDGRTWKMWRDAPSFAQRMTGTFSEDGNKITVKGELSRDGATWEPDLDVIYTKRSTG